MGFQTWSLTVGLLWAVVSSQHHALLLSFRGGPVLGIDARSPPHGEPFAPGPAPASEVKIKFSGSSAGLCGCCLTLSLNASLQARKGASQMPRAITAALTLSITQYLGLIAGVHLSLCSDSPQRLCSGLSITPARGTARPYACAASAAASSTLRLSSPHCSSVRAQVSCGPTAADQLARRLPQPGE